MLIICKKKLKFTRKVRQLKKKILTQNQFYYTRYTFEQQINKQSAWRNLDLYN